MTVNRFFQTELKNKQDEFKRIGDEAVRGVKLAIDDARKRTLEPQRSYMWEISVRDKSDYGFPDMRFYARNCSLPVANNETIRRYYMGNSFFSPGIDASAKMMRCTFWDDKSLKAYRYFHRWFNQQHDPRQGKQVSFAKLKKDVVVRLKDTTDVYITGEMLFKDCFIMEVSEMMLNYYENDVVNFDVAFQFSNRFINNTDYKV